MLCVQCHFLSRWTSRYLYCCYTFKIWMFTGAVCGESIWNQPSLPLSCCCCCAGGSVWCLRWSPGTPRCPPQTHISCWKHWTSQKTWLAWCYLCSPGVTVTWAAARWQCLPHQCQVLMQATVGNLNKMERKSILWMVVSSRVWEHGSWKLCCSWC